MVVTLIKIIIQITANKCKISTFSYTLFLSCPTNISIFQASKQDMHVGKLQSIDLLTCTN